MAVVFKTNSDILRDNIILCVNGIAALRAQLADLTDDGVRTAIETSIIKLSTRLDALVGIENDAAWKMPALDNQDIASQKFDTEKRKEEYALFALEVQKQVALGHLQYVPPPQPETVDTEPPQSKPHRKKKK